MKLIFVYYAYENQGSELDLQGYVSAGHLMGHEVRVYGRPNPKIPLDYTRDVRGADSVVFVFEWTTGLQYGDRLDWLRLLSAVPRNRRVVIDCDGRYNDPIRVEGDYNHRDEAESRWWVDFCDELSDKICQPTLCPLKQNVLPFLFHVYDPAWEAPLDFSSKEFGLAYVGHSKFRWPGLMRVLRPLERVRAAIGRVALFGHGWDRPPDWAAEMGIEEIYRTDPELLARLGVESMRPVPFSKVIETMSRAAANPVIYRPLFERLGMVTCRTFETPAAGTIPLFALDPEYVRSVYGERAMELVLEGESAHEKLLDVVSHPDRFAQIVREIRLDFARKHSPEARLAELIEIIQS